jgi:hypothetical protein
MSPTGSRLCSGESRRYAQMDSRREMWILQHLSRTARNNNQKSCFDVFLMRDSINKGPFPLIPARRDAKFDPLGIFAAA